MHRDTVRSVHITAALTVLAAASCFGGAPSARAGGTTLELAFPDGIVCLAPGDIFRVLVEMTDVPPGTPAAGFQAFLEYETTKASFLTGNYPSVPFGLPVIPIAGPAGELDLAAGINVAIAQLPTSTDSVVAELFFISIDGDADNAVRFRAALPETKLTQLGGAPILPLTLIDLSEFSGNIVGDLNGDGTVDGADLGLLLGNWGPCVPPNLECLGDLNCDKVVDGADLGILLGSWT